MSAHHKDKRTKEQIIRLLDKALTQEEHLSEKIKNLEVQLADCRKKAEDPRHELTEGALSASKVSFRIDYYRTAESGPLKGIIEHLPSRHNRPFEGDGIDAISVFIYHFLNEDVGNSPKKAKNVAEKKSDLNLPEEAAIKTHTAMPHTESTSTTTSIEMVDASTTPETTTTFGSSLMRRLKAEFEEEAQNVETSIEDKPQYVETATSGISPRVRRLLELSATEMVTDHPRTRQAMPPQEEDEPTNVGQGRLLQRLRKEYMESLNQL